MPLKTFVDDHPALNLTSLIDVTFLLIVFFMLGTQFIDPERDINLTVPEVNANAPLTAAPAKKVINVFADGQITIDRRNVTLPELTKELVTARSEYEGLGVLVRGDAQSAFQTVAEVLSACKEAGIAELGISVRMASTPQVHR
jgi:biopolymer transport protein ExbD